MNVKNCASRKIKLLVIKRHQLVHRSDSPCPCFNETLEINDANLGPRRCRLKNGKEKKRGDGRAKLEITPGTFMIKTLYLPSILSAFAFNLIHWSKMFCKCNPSWRRQKETMDWRQEILTCLRNPGSGKQHSGVAPRSFPVETLVEKS